MDEITTGPAVTTLRDIVRRDRSRVVEVPVSEGAILGVNTKEDLERVSNRSFR
jgi:CTP:molybdopterin cytidylyltransferase MocA